MLEFIQRAMGEAAEYFSKSIINELELQKVIAGEQYKNLEQQLREIKSDHSREKDHLESKLRSVEIQKAELSAIE
jgi:hypothetical protein